MKTFTLEQIHAHHTTQSLWIIVNNKVYDVTDFLFDHPGGEALILQHAGQDITEIFTSELEHVHSDAAFELLNDYCIGQVSLEKQTERKPTKGNRAADSAVDLRRSNDFVDLSKPLFSQILYGDFDRDVYVEQVHLPRHTKTSPPIFAHPLMNALTKCYWWVIPMFWGPVICTFLYYANLAVPFDFVISGYVFGLGLWTLIEYSLHRFVFHMDYWLPNYRWAMALHFLSHGVHHLVPMDRMRLVMPPALGLILSIPICYMIHSVFPTGLNFAIIAGGYSGFVCYDLFHYYTHHGKPTMNYIKNMKSYHLDHHYKNSNLGYGVTSKFWDMVFGTTL